MPYVRGQVEDEQIHERYHRMVLGGIDYPGYKNETVVARYTNDHPEGSTKPSTASNRRISGDFQGSRIVMISMDPGLASASSGKEGTSTFEKKKVKKAADQEFLTHLLPQSNMTLTEDLFRLSLLFRSRKYFRS